MLVFNLHLLLTILSLTCEVFIARFADCHFNEDAFLSLRGEKPIAEEWREITWTESSFSHLDQPTPPPPPPPPHTHTHTKQSELEVQKIIHLQNLANRLLDVFIDSTKVTKSHIPAANIQAQIEIPMGKLKYSVANEPKP